MARAQLSIGMIFKNESRCLERCLQSLQPLRRAVPCELVMADTGSTDGSREIAERYADVLFDFPWIDDFSAARNAVINRCTGKWFLSIDSDEWMDEDIGELTELLKSPLRRAEQAGTVIIRNYLSDRLSDGDYRDFLAIRLIRISSGLRYVGAIHEHVPVVANEEPIIQLKCTILHHDGYVGLNDERGREKRERNLALIRSELEKDPDNMSAILQYIESGRKEPDYMDYIRRGVEVTCNKKHGWKQIGPALLRYAAAVAKSDHLPEFEAWSNAALELFPESYFTNIDVAYMLTVDCWEKEDYAGCARWGERYLSAIKEFRAGKGDMNGLLFSTLQMGAEEWERNMRIIVSLARGRLNGSDSAGVVELLEQMDCSGMSGKEVQDYLKALIELRAEGALVRFYREFCQGPDDKSKAHKTVFLKETAALFDPQYRDREQLAGKGHAFAALKALSGSCEIGTAAAILEAEDPAEMEVLLAEITNWDLLPIAALEHALASGAAFPPRLLNLEAADKLAARLSRKGGLLVEFAIRAGKLEFGDGFPALIWARGLVLAAMQTRDWQKDGNAALCHAFAKVMGVFLPRYYGAEALCGEGVLSLPLMHRFGWYCAQAFRAKEDGDPAEYVRILRLGLENCEAARPIVEFLLENLQEEQGRIETTPELLALAEQVRNLLCVYPADDPAVEALKQSAAYRQVAHLIERPNTAFTGSIKQ